MGSLLKNRLLLLFTSVFNLPFVYYCCALHFCHFIGVVFGSSLFFYVNIRMFFARLHDKICPDFEKPKIFLSATRFLRGN